MRESKVERYLHTEVTRLGGTTRKMKGRKNDCDRLVIWPKYGGFSLSPGAVNFLGAAHRADIHFVECKAPGKHARAGQAREHKRLRKFGCAVFVLDSKPAIDLYIRRYLGC